MISNKEKNYVSAVVYVHNNEKNIKDFINKINNVLNNTFEKYEIIFVNDASTDKTREIISEESKLITTGIVTTINMSFLQGVETAMNAGIDLAIGDFVFEFDSIELDYDLSLITDIYFKSLEGYDIVSAVPNNVKMTSKMFYKVFNKYANMENQLRTERFKIISRRGINRVDSMNVKIPYRKAVYANCGLKQTFIQYKVSPSSQGKSTIKDRRELAIDSLLLFTDIGYRISISMATIMLLFSVFVAIYSIFIFVNGNPVAGWTTTMLFLSFSFFGLFSLLTILIKYTQLLLNLQFTKQDYIIEGIEKDTK
ncbi:group 2 family glycosyl transferase [Coprobacillus sp. 8_1_38FAA]|uniref:glycosyltransferase n=1 Tax=Faecalibacillus faecis TaxID=1982628 RepID=UPI000664A97F|nr:glycosyltransferase [Faecalibacillus faecis]KMV77482.1 group 2 family glycosyl transferase [Coprobacillus sp. 8_1_38FAA]